MKIIKHYFFVLMLAYVHCVDVTQLEFKYIGVHWSRQFDGIYQKWSTMSYHIWILMQSYQQKYKSNLDISTYTY